MSGSRYGADDEESKKKSQNDYRDIKKFAMLERITLDLDSPRLRKACLKLGIDASECVLKQKQEFFPKGLDEGIAKMRYKHYQKSHLGMMNRVFEERYRIKLSE